MERLVMEFSYGVGMATGTNFIFFILTLIAIKINQRTISYALYIIGLIMCLMMSYSGFTRMPNYLTIIPVLVCVATTMAILVIGYRKLKKKYQPIIYSNYMDPASEVNNTVITETGAEPLKHGGQTEKEKLKNNVAKIMYCRRCGARLPADSTFCNKCGTKI